MEEVLDVLVDKKDTHSAISTWSGFEYQGRIAIYWVLQMLNQKNIVSDNIEEYSLEIEHLEDFTIKYRNNPYTIHQVKAYQNNSSFSSYKEAVLELMGKCAKYDSISALHLHTCCIVNVPDKERLRITLIETNPKKKVTQFTEYKKLLFEDEKFDEVYNKLFINDVEEGNLSRVVDVMESKNEIKKQVKVFLMQNAGLIKRGLLDSEENIDYIVHNLINEMSLLIASGHAKQTDTFEIPFSRIIDIFKNEYVYKFTNQTATSMLKVVLDEYFLEYCDSMELTSEECIIWRENWNKICDLSDENFLLLCKKLSPNNNLISGELDVFMVRETIVKAGVHKTLFPLVLQAGRYALSIENIKEMFVLKKEGIYHLITTIAEIAGKKSVRIQGEKIFEALKNDNNLAYLLFDIDKLITNELEGTFNGKIMDIGSDYEQVIPNFTEKEPITIPKKMEFITINYAKEVFK
jgi:hypothetical protein